MPPEPGVGWVAPDQAGIVSDYRKTKTPGVYVRHQTRARPPLRTPRDAAAPRRSEADAGSRDAASMAWSPTFSDRAEVLSWLAANDEGPVAVQEAQAAGPTFSALAGEWLDGVRTGAIGRRRGKRQHGLLGHNARGLRALAPLCPRARVRCRDRLLASSLANGRPGSIA